MCLEKGSDQLFVYRGIYRWSEPFWRDGRYPKMSYNHMIETDWRMRWKSWKIKFIKNLINECFLSGISTRAALPYFQYTSRYSWLHENGSFSVHSFLFKPSFYTERLKFSCNYWTFPHSPRISIEKTSTTENC